MIAELRRSRLLADGGVTVVDLLDDRWLTRLRQEAGASYADHAEHRQTTPALDRWDRGNPDRWLRTAAGGPALAALMASDHLADVLGEHTGSHWASLSPQGSFSYYDRPGHYLGIHRDIVRCDLTCIVCCDLAGAGGGAELLAYRWAVREPLDRVRSQPDRAVTVALQPGQAALILGGLVPHRVTPVVGGLRRAVAPLCFTPRR